MKYKAVRGMEDILPEDVGIWQELERIARTELNSCGYLEIRTPILEDTSIFTRGIGETTDIVTKEMFTFTDKKGRSLTLRPEGTAPIVRAYIEHSLDKVSPELKLYYIGPMFRRERPQKGRARQFYQIGAEIIGTNSYFADVEIIMQVSNMLRLFGLNDFTIKLNSLGCKDDKSKFAEKLKKYLETKKARLCGDCNERTAKNVLRVLDCKARPCMQVVSEAPDILGSLCDPCKDHFDKLRNALSNLKINFRETKNLVRGLDYYTGPVFEITHPALGAQNAIGAGGRYDNLVKDFGGPAVGACGYALGMERLIIAFKDKKDFVKFPPVIYVATLGDIAKFKGIQIAEKIKSEGYIVLTDIKEASLKSQMRTADKAGARFVLILGEDEIKANKVTIKDMLKKEQVSVLTEDIAEELKERIQIQFPDCL